jgi:hypothetical protein
MKLLITAILLSAALMEPAAAGANTVGKVAESNTVDTVGVSTYAACPRLKVRPKPGAVVTPRNSGAMGRAMISVSP